jgi:hypothetical protein
MCSKLVWSFKQERKAVSPTWVEPWRLAGLAAVAAMMTTGHFFISRCQRAPSLHAHIEHLSRQVPTIYISDTPILSFIVRANRFEFYAYLVQSIVNAHRSSCI